MGRFSTILADGIARGYAPGKTIAAREWYREAAKDFGAKVRDTGSIHSGRIDYQRINEKKFLNEDPTALTTEIEPGSMYMFIYDAKHKDTLPYWDRFPLLLPFNVSEKHITGLNLHYLDLRSRSIAFDALYELRTNNRYDETTTLRMSWEVLKKMANHKYFAPCVHMYLKTHVKSQFMLINPEYWDICLWTPSEKFQGASKTKVWADSNKKIGS